MILVGVDSGVSGAACAVSVYTGRVDVIDLPMAQDGKAKQLDVPSFSRWLHRVDAARVVIERQWPRPEEGSVGAFRAGLIYGQLRATTLANGIPLSLVTPARWKADLGLSSDKEACRQAAIAKFPELADRLTRKMDHNRSESALIAMWGAMNWRGLLAGTV